MNIQKELEKLELELQEMEKEQEYLKASFYVNQKILPFLQKYNNSGIYKTKIQEYKEKLRDIGKKSINEMQSIEFETPID
jgi:hypothetical protein